MIANLNERRNDDLALKIIIEVEMKKSTTRIFCLGLVIALLLCSVNCLNPESTYAASKKKIHLKKTTVSIVAGKTYQQKLINKKGKTIKATKVKWKSRNSSVAKINRKGKIRAVKAGTAKMTAKYKGKIYKFTVKVKRKPTPNYNSSIRINPTTLQVELGKTKTVIVSTDRGYALRCTSNNANADFEWGDWISMTSCELKVKGEYEGDTVLTVYDSKNSNVRTTLRVKVVPPALNIETPSVPTKIYGYLRSGQSTMFVTYCSISKIEIQKTYLSSSDEYQVKLIIYGKKMKDALGTDSPCYIDCKLYDSDGYLIDSGRFVEKVNTGEKFMDYQYLYLKPGNYTLKMFDVVVEV